MRYVLLEKIHNEQQMIGVKPSQFAPVIQSIWGIDVHVTKLKGCKTCAVQEVDCKDRWDEMMETGGGKVQCWRPPGSILIWGEEIYDGGIQKTGQISELANGSVTLETL